MGRDRGSMPMVLVLSVLFQYMYCMSLVLLLQQNQTLRTCLGGDRTVLRVLQLLSLKMIALTRTVGLGGVRTGLRLMRGLLARTPHRQVVRRRLEKMLSEGSLQSRALESARRRTHTDSWST